MLLDRKDRLSMACGLEVRVPFTDHRLVEYVWNVPWSMKEAGGIEKGLLRTAAACLPPDLLNRRKSMYPGAADQAYERAIDAQLRDLLQKPSAPLFDLIDHNQLTEAYARDPRLTGFMAIQPSSTTPSRSCSTSTDGSTAPASPSVWTVNPPRTTPSQNHKSSSRTVRASAPTASAPFDPGQQNPGLAFTAIPGFWLAERAITVAAAARG